MTEPIRVGELLPGVVAEAIARAGPGYDRWAEQAPGLRVVVAERRAAQRRRPGRSSRYVSQPNRAIESGSATNATRGATASTLTTSVSWIDMPAASVPTPAPAWEGRRAPAR